MQGIVFLLAREPRIPIAYAMSGTAASGCRHELDGFLLHALSPHHPADCRAHCVKGSVHAKKGRCPKLVVVCVQMAF